MQTAFLNPARVLKLRYSILTRSVSEEFLENFNVDSSSITRRAVNNPSTWYSERRPSEIQYVLLLFQRKSTFSNNAVNALEPPTKIIIVYV